MSRSIEIFKTTGDKDVDEFVKSAAISNSQFVLFTIRIEVRTRQNITTSSRGKKSKFTYLLRTKDKAVASGLSTFLVELVVFGIGKVEILQYYPGR